MIKLAMVRHGQTNYNFNGLIQGRINIPLNETGKKQALDLAQFLKLENNHFDMVLSSPLSRALETAYIISNYLEIFQPILIIQKFVERDFGFLDGLSVTHGRDFVRSKSQHPTFENDQQLIQRIVSHTFDLLKDHDGQTLLCVAHSHVIKALLIYSNPKDFTFADYILGNGDILYFEISKNQIKFIQHKENPIK
ncbi:MAG: histidine phosphatase family protein [Acholeplasmataceae bacterium]